MKTLKVIIVYLLVAVTFVSAESSIKVACVGNSITFGSGIKERDKDSYPAVLGKLLGNGFEVRNFGIGGRTCLNKGDRPYMKEKIYQEALEFNPDIVIIKLGTNDTKPENWKFESEFENDLTTMVKSFKNLVSKPKIYLCYPATAYKVQWGINDSTIVNGVIPHVNAVAKKCNTGIIDMHKVTANMPENFPDNIHPNVTGAAIMANAVYNILLNDYPSIRKQAVKWMKKAALPVSGLKPDNSVDAVAFKREYEANPAVWNKVFNWLKENDPATVATGKYVIDSTYITVTVTEGPSVREFEKTKWEYHKKNIDLQYIAKGKEKMGIAPLTKATLTGFDDKKDNGSLTIDDNASKYVVAQPGKYLLFFPSDAHRPNIKVDCDTVKKIVFKIRSCMVR
jgi:YhcH/YjgK/YiaL family protein